MCNSGFRVEGTRIIGPDGQEFIQKGTNINGYYCWWEREVTQDAGLIGDVWKFNTVRVNCVLRPDVFLNNGGYKTNNDIDKIIKVFTDRKIVVQLEAHDFTGSYPDGETALTLEKLAEWHADLARKYINNPYVWFNVMNEPGKGGLPIERWKTTHEAVIKAIRSTGSKNIIVLDGHGYAGELGESGPGFVTEKDSAILTYGGYLAENYDNLVFSVHMYGWTGPVKKFEDFVDKVHNKGLALMVGEFGSGVNQEGHLGSSADTVVTTLKVCRDKKLGWLHWAWDGGDIFDLTDEDTIQGGGWEVDAGTGSKPANLSWMGEKLWKDTHEISQSFNEVDVAVSDIILDRNDFAVGEELQVQAIIKNTGDLPIPADAKIAVKYFIDETEISTGCNIGGLGLQQTASILSTTFKAPKPCFEIKAEIDAAASCYGEDSNKANNRRIITVMTANSVKADDLAVMELKVLPEKLSYDYGDYVAFEATVKNMSVLKACEDFTGAAFYVNGIRISAAEGMRSSCAGETITLKSRRKYVITGRADVSFKLFKSAVAQTNGKSYYHSLLKTINYNTPEGAYNIVLNPGFEYGHEFWHSWGGTEIEESSIPSGGKALKVKEGRQGGGYQSVKLKSDTSYVLGVRGRTDGLQDESGTIGVKYQLPDDTWPHHTLVFTESRYTYKEISFTTPESFRDTTLYIWKGSVNTGFYIDEVILKEVK